MKTTDWGCITGGLAASPRHLKKEYRLWQTECPIDAPEYLAAGSVWKIDEDHNGPELVIPRIAAR